MIWSINNLMIKAWPSLFLLCALFMDFPFCNLWKLFNYCIIARLIQILCLLFNQRIMRSWASFNLTCIRRPLLPIISWSILVLLINIDFIQFYYLCWSRFLLAVRVDTPIVSFNATSSAWIITGYSAHENLLLIGVASWSQRVLLVRLESFLQVSLSNAATALSTLFLTFISGLFSAAFTGPIGACLLIP